MLEATRTNSKAFLRKAFKVNGEQFSEETEAKMNELADRIIIIAKWSAKIFIVATIFMLIFGESRYIEGDVPLMWRIQYEWTHLFRAIAFHLFALDEMEGGGFE